MSAGYQASKSSSQPSVSSSASASRSVQAKSSSTGSSSSSNPWNEYQRAHAGSGLTRSEMSAGYQAAKAGITAKSTAAAKSLNSSSGPASWNEFQHQHAGQGLTKRQMSLLYKHQSERSASTSTATTRSKVSQTAQKQVSDALAKPARRANTFNEFQKQYKKDHPDEKLNAAQLAQLYRAEQQDHQLRAELEPKASAAPLPERLRRQVEEMLLNLAMMQELPDMPLDERDEWGHVAHQLEWEEGNYNRQSFVDAHGQADEWGAHDVDVLQECEFIESDRLELSLEDDKRIGSGGCGAVYAAMVDKTIRVAVKVIDSISTKSKQLFEREMLAMMKTSAHENVLRVLGYTVLSGESGRQSYGIIMELMGGGDLAFALHRDESVNLSEEDRLRALLQVIKAIEYIHSQGITHRDIKPHNVLLSTDHQTAKLADFGLAGFKNTTLSTQQSHITKENNALVALGLTPAYAAPEVFEGKLSFRDQAAWKKSDVFSFTVLLTELLMEMQPWEFETPQFIMNSVSKHQKRPFEIEDLVVFGGKASNAELRLLVQDGWHQDPANRPTATEMRQRLEQIITAGQSVSAGAIGLNAAMTSFTAEPFVRGGYKKYDSNRSIETGGHSLSDTAQAFSHFTWQKTLGQLLIVGFKEVGSSLQRCSVCQAEVLFLPYCDYKNGTEIPVMCDTCSADAVEYQNLDKEKSEADIAMSWMSLSESSGPRD
ncbi:hypothetical protein BBJ28_00001536 [Nothophytophthora sp. Chile5]|nr:hypothetical protein BBJ28_00001536 [Nothophytophthora sp. Chile5]